MWLYSRRRPICHRCTIPPNHIYTMSIQEVWNGSWTLSQRQNQHMNDCWKRDILLGSVAWESFSQYQQTHHKPFQALEKSRPIVGNNESTNQINQHHHLGQVIGYLDINSMKSCTIVAWSTIQRTWKLERPYKSFLAKLFVEYIQATMIQIWSRSNAKMGISILAHWLLPPMGLIPWFDHHWQDSYLIIWHRINHYQQHHHHPGYSPTRVLFV